MNLSRNFLAGLSSSVWVGLVSLASIPFYVSYLGLESYGLIGFFLTLQALFQLLDMGLTPTMNKEVASCEAAGGIQNAGKLLHTLAIIYWVVAGVIALLTMLAAPMIAREWLQLEFLTFETALHAVVLMGIVLACRWPIGLYQGAIIGAQRLIVSSSINIVMVTIVNVGAIAILHFISPTIEAFFLWQAAIGFVYVMVMRWAAWRIIGRLKNLKFSIKDLKRVWLFSAGMFGVTFLGLLLSQVDKVILSRILSLENFSYYMLATVVVNSLFVLISPLFNTIFPRFTALVINNEKDELMMLYRLGTRLFATVLFSLAMFLILCAHDLVLVWMNDADIAMQVAPILSLLIIGSALHGVMYFPYALQLAYGYVRLTLKICMVLVAVMLPLVVFSALQFGAVGAAGAWVALNLLYVFFGTWLTHRYLLEKIGLTWLIQDVGVPLGLATLVGVIGGYFFQGITDSPYLTLFIGMILALISAVLSLASSKALRIKMICYFKTLKILKHKKMESWN
ncbi:MAG: oligosaccharide flippase family protein [Mariprofundaceae bacterium]|nr:oligosaccharide flippase family protein [Mariprofundaceae bacterium]